MLRNWGKGRVLKLIISCFVTPSDSFSEFRELKRVSTNLKTSLPTLTKVALQIDDIKISRIDFSLAAHVCTLD